MKTKLLLGTLLLVVSTAMAQPAKPIGVYALLPTEDPNISTETCWSDPNIKGVVIRDFWSNVEASEGTYNWNYYDQGMRIAAQKGKNVIAMIAMGVEAPNWLYSANPPVASRSTPDGTMPLPWDTNFLNPSTSTGYCDTIVHKFCNHLHSNVYNAVVLAVSVWDGGESGTEDFFNCANQTEASEWQGAAEAIGLDWYYNTWFNCFLSTGNPFPGDGGVTMTNVAQYLLATGNTAGWYLGLETNGASNNYPNGAYFAHTNVLLANAGWTCFQDVSPILEMGAPSLMSVAQNIVNNGGMVWEIYWSANGNDRDNDPAGQGEQTIEWFNQQVGAP
jgi:hypothetical protein